MWGFSKDEDLLDKFSKNAKILGIFLVVLGVIGIAFPAFMSIATNIFVSWLLLFSGISVGYFTYISDKSDWLGWLKSFIMVGVSLYMLFFPMGGVATLGMLLSIYFFMDAFSSFALASSHFGNGKWWIWLLNALLSLGVGIFFIIGWPFSSLFLVGIFVGISLLFDGIALLMGAKMFNDLTKI